MAQPDDWQQSGFTYFLAFFEQPMFIWVIFRQDCEKLKISAMLSGWKQILPNESWSFSFYDSARWVPTIYKMELWGGPIKMAKESMAM